MGSSHNNWPFILNLGNSIIGVAMLAMPYCFQKCGIILSIVVLVLCTWLTLISCTLLMKAGITCRRRSYEFLAYYTHGAPGKFVSEIGMIGFQLGTLIAQIVVIGDLGPSILTKFFGIQNSSGLRTFLIVFLCLSVGLPMALIRDIRSVSRVSAVCVAFYSTFVVYVFCLAVPNLWLGDWYEKVYFWRPEGFFQCLPILSFSFGCQTQLFLLYDALPEPSLKAMSKVVNSAVNLCAVAYLMVGFCGYIAFYTHDIPGDVIGIFPNVFFTDLMKICFVISIVITFPVMVFPCRASIYTLLFAKKSKARDELIDLDTHMPAKELRIITTSLVVGSMIIAILIPNVEFILGMNGAIMGTLICYIFPALFFLKVMGNKPEGKNLAQMVLVLGITILLVSTYSTLRSQENVSTHISGPDEALLKPGDSIVGAVVPKNLDVDKIKLPDIQTVSKQPGSLDSADVVADVRKEPPNPHPPDNIAKPAEDAKPNDQNAIKRDQIDKVNVSARDMAAGDSDKLAEANKENDKLAEANKAKELELQEKEMKQAALLAELEKQRNEQQKLIEEQRQLLKEFKDHHDKDMKQEVPQQAVQNPENANQPLPQPANLQLGLDKQQNVQEPVVRPERSSEDKQDIPPQQPKLLPVTETSRLDSLNQQQGGPQAAPLGQVNALSSNEKPQGDFVGANVAQLELQATHEQVTASKVVTQKQEELLLVPVEIQGVHKQSTQFYAQKEQQHLLQKQETPLGTNKQQLQFDSQEKLNPMVLLETKPQQPQTLEPHISQQEQPQGMNKVPPQENQQPLILPQALHQQPQNSHQEQHSENIQIPTVAPQQPVPQSDMQPNQENKSQKPPSLDLNMDAFVRQKRFASEQQGPLVNDTGILQTKENQNSSLPNETAQQKDKSEVATEGNKSIVEKNVYATSTEKVSEKLNSASILQSAKNDSQKSKANEEMRRKLKSLDEITHV